MKIFTSILTSFLMMLSMVVPSVPQIPTSSLVYFYEGSDAERRIVNNYAGYSYRIPDGFEVDVDYISLRLRLENEKTIIDIYNERENNTNSYINYTHEAVLTSPELYVTEQSYSTYADKITYKLSWTRNKLQRVENDKNYYLKYDICADDSVYTIMVKSAEEITDADTYLNNFAFTNKGTFDAEYVKSLDKRITAEEKNWNEETEQAYKDLFETEGIRWGIFSPDYSNGFPELSWYEEQVGYKFTPVLHYSELYEEYNDAVVGAFLRRAYDDGRIVELTLQPPGNADPANMMYDLLNGKYDKFLTDYAQAVKDFGHPVLLRLYNEMNGDWCEYSSYQMSADTDLFKKAYNYTASFFDDCDNVIFVWNPNGKSFPDFDWNDIMMHIPESKYVDVIGLTMYNTGNYYRGEEWKSFDELYGELYSDMKSRSDLPMMITEFACAREGGDKEAWTEDMFREIKKYNDIKIAIWWNYADFDAKGNLARVYYINDSDEMVEIFKNNLNNSDENSENMLAISESIYYNDSILQ